MEYGDCDDPYPSLASGLGLARHRHGLSMRLCPLSVALVSCHLTNPVVSILLPILPHVKFSLLYQLETCLLPSVSETALREGYDAYCGMFS